MEVASITRAILNFLLIPVAHSIAQPELTNCTQEVPRSAVPSSRSGFVSAMMAGCHPAPELTKAWENDRNSGQAG